MHRFHSKNSQFSRSSVIMQSVGPAVRIYREIKSNANVANAR